MSDALHKSDIDVEVSDVDELTSKVGTSEAVTSPRRLGVVERALGTVTALPAATKSVEDFAPREAYIAELELHIRELVEIEKMRDVEIRHLEAEAEQQAARIHALETALFHAERRANDLDRRWNALAEVYSSAAAALVVAGGKLEAIHQQAGYRAVLTISNTLRRYPALYTRLQRRLHRSRSRTRLES